MTALSPGANAALPDGDLTVSIRHGTLPGAEIDVSVFLVTASGKVRSDADMCFYGQPSIAGGAVALAAASSGETRFIVAPGRIPAGVEKVILTATIHENRAAFGRLPEIGLEVGGISGRIPCVGMTETALILAEVYQRNGAWKVRVVGQGFNGGLAKLAPHLGVEVDASPLAPPTQPAAPTKPVSLTKAGQTHALSLVKGAAAPRELVVEATWVDNGDNDDDNDDLDLRVGILWPNGRMALVTAPDRPGAFDAQPWVVHTGDCLGASTHAPSTETVRVNPAIARNAGGPVAIVFSVYSAVDNGMVSVASMRPKMRIAYGNQRIECAFDFTSKKGIDDDVYTYVIGLVEIDGDRVVVQPSGLTSERGSEATPWLSRTSQGVQITVDGPTFFKGDDATNPTDDGRDYA